VLLIEVKGHRRKQSQESRGNRELLKYVGKEEGEEKEYRGRGRGAFL
jgi:hypothetical protein